MGIPKTETLKHQQAFELYYSMGAKRSLSQLSETIGVSTVSLSGWSKTFNWQRRIIERDGGIINQMQKFGVMGPAEAIAYYRGLVQRAVQTFMKKFEGGGDVPLIESMSDLERAIRLDLHLLSMVPGGENVNKDQNVNLFNILVQSGLSKTDLRQVLDVLRDIRDGMSGARPRSAKLLDVHVEEDINAQDG